MLGKFKNLISRNGVASYRGTSIPVRMANQIKRNVPLPCTISGSSQVTFTLNCSTTNPMTFWSGMDYFELSTTLAYTFVASANNDILSSAGAFTADQAPATGIWYYYVGIDIAGDAGTTDAIVMYPSQTGPSFVEDEFGMSHLSHPGLSKTTFWNYVGWSYCDATTPTFVAATKIGYRWNFAEQKVNTTSSWAELAFVLPKLGALGGMAGGSVNSGAASTVTVGSTATNTLGVVKVGDPTASGDQYAPLSPMPITANGKLYASDAGVRGDVAVTYVDDVV